MAATRQARTQRSYAPELRDGGVSPRALRRGAAAGAGLALLVAGAVLGRASAPAQVAAPAAVAQSAAPQPALGPGGTRVVAGVTVGYADTRPGAVAAATEYATVLAGPLLGDASAYRSAVATLAAPQAQATIESQADSALSGLQQLYGIGASGGGAGVIRSIPLAWHVDAFTPDSASVSIWVQTLIAVPGRVAPRSSWATGTYTLTWTGGDWRLLDDTSSDGPAPQVLQTPPDPNSLPPQLSQWSAYTAAQ